MTSIARSVAALTVILLLIVGSAGSADSEPSGIEEFPVSFFPPVRTVEQDETFSVDLQADPGAAQFNAYEVTIEFDPQVIELVGVAEGMLMLSGCGATFVIPGETDSTVTYFHTILCNGVSLDGPGILSTYHFRATGAGSSPISVISSPDSSIFDAGTFVNPLHAERPRQVIFSDAAVTVGESPTEGPEGTAASGVSLRAFPNPMRETTELRFATETGGWTRLDIFDVRGRRVFSREWTALTPGVHRETWRGVGRAGRRLAGGVYVVRVVGADGARSTRITLTR